MLGELGYGIAYRVLDAQFFGVPQRRRRVFVVGHLGDWRGPAAVLLEWSGLSGYPAPRRETRKDLAPTLSARTHGGGGPGTDFDLDGGLIPSTGDTSHCLNAGGMGRQDYETETLISYPLLGKGNDSQDSTRQTYVAHALSADGFDASEDGTGRGTPMVPVAICTAHTQSNGSGFSDDVAHTLESRSAQAVAFAQNSRDEVRLHVGDGKTVGALSAQPGAKQQSYVAFSAKDCDIDAGDIAPTLRSMGHSASHANGGGQVAIAFAQNQEGAVLSGDVMQSLGTNSNATGRNAPTIAFTLHGSDGTTRAASSTDVAGSLRTRAPGSIENSSTTAVLQEQSVAWSGELTASTDVAGTLQRGEGGRVDGVMTPQMAVRRLTPREC